MVKLQVTIGSQKILSIVDRINKGTNFMIRKVTNRTKSSNMTTLGKMEMGLNPHL